VILSQLGNFTVFFSEYSNKVIKAIDTVLHLGQIDPQTTAIGALTVAVILLVDRTRLRNFSLLAGMVIGSVALIVLSATDPAGWEEVQQVNDIAVIPTSLPLPKLPDFKLVPALVLDAMVLAIIRLVQGVGVSQAYANPDGDYPNPSRDFIGQGAANIGAGLLQGMPIGGAIASTALNISAGAKSRWANIFSGLLVAVVVLLFSRAVSLVVPAMPDC
jgi:SulP family sulfate permease